MFLRENPGRANAGREYVDQIFFGRDFFDTHKERLLKLKMHDLLIDGRVVSFQQLVTSTGVPFTQLMYFRLITVGNFALDKYAAKANSNGTSLSLRDYVCRTRKDSKRFRLVLA
jgi:hypothetical protein